MKTKDFIEALQYYLYHRYSHFLLNTLITEHSFFKKKNNQHYVRVAFEFIPAVPCESSSWCMQYLFLEVHPQQHSEMQQEEYS